MGFMKPKTNQCASPTLLARAAGVSLLTPRASPVINHRRRGEVHHDPE
jgi:hypothetical protein